jgi:hypothetical protein
VDLAGSNIKPNAGFSTVVSNLFNIVWLLRKKSIQDLSSLEKFISRYTSEFELKT